MFKVCSISSSRLRYMYKRLFARKKIINIDNRNNTIITVREEWAILANTYFLFIL